MIRDTVRLTFKLLRFEASVIVAVGLLLVLFLLGEGWRLLSLDLAACSALAPLVDCATRHAEFDAQFMIVVVLELVAAVVTVFSGLVLGIAVVGREIERGTTSLAWSLAQSRRQWLFVRWLVVGLGLVALSVAIGLATEPLSTAMRSTGRAGAFEGVEVRAPVLALRAIAAFTVAIFVGAVAGRTLPGLLVAVFVMPLLVLGIDQGMGAWLRSVAQPLDANAASTSRIVDTQWRELSTGRVLSRLEYLRVTPPPSAPPDWDASNFEPIPIGVPDSRAAEYVVIECLLLGGVTAVVLAASSVVVERRRPR
jgi:ABC-type transport system involved in multi-copper enzyme maturation permease subunit